MGLLLYIAFFIPLLPVIVALFKWPSMNLHQKCFGIMLVFIVIVSFSGRIWTIVRMESNLPFFYVYILGEFLFLLQIFRIMFGKKIKNLIWISLATGFTILWFINVLLGEGWWVFPDYIRGLEAIIVLVLIILWFLKMLKEKIILYPYKTFEFWISAGLLIFFSGNFLVFTFSKILLNAGKEVFEAIWEVNSVLIVLLYLFYTVGLLWIKKTVKSY